MSYPLPINVVTELDEVLAECDKYWVIMKQLLNYATATIANETERSKWEALYKEIHHLKLTVTRIQILYAATGPGRKKGEKERWSR